MAICLFCANKIEITEKIRKIDVNKIDVFATLFSLLLFAEKVWNKNPVNHDEPTNKIQNFGALKGSWTLELK